MKILIVEDEKMAADRLQSLIKKYDSRIEVLGRLDSVKSASQWLIDNPTPDLMFFDIQLADGLSFEIFDIVKVQSPIIFTTAFDEYAIKAFKVNSIDYLLKPLDQDELNRAMEKFKALHDKPVAQDYSQVLDILKSQLDNKAPQYKNRFIIKIGEHIKSIPSNSILYVFSQDKATYMVTTEHKKYLIEYSLDKIEKQLDPEVFFRANRQYLISIESIKDIVSYSNSRLKLILQQSDDNDILVSRDKTNEFKEWLDR
jgi:two-component system, LytTR family, response regulator